jgi:hypothetical protein
MSKAASCRFSSAGSRRFPAISCSTAEKSTYYFEFLPDALLKGDIKSSRYAAYAVATTNGWMSDERHPRPRKHEPHRPDGDQYFRPMNLQPLDMPQLPPEKPPAPAKPKRRSKTDA